MLLILARCVDSITLSLRINQCTVRWCSSVNLEISKAQDGSNFATYLMQNFGVTKYSATKAAKDWALSNSDRCNAVVAFFKDQGFSEVQISKLIRGRPILLTSNPQITKPKIEFLKSIIPEPSEVYRVISTYPTLLTSSLEKRLIPSFNFISNLLGSEKDAANTVLRAGGVLMINSEIMRNLEILKKYGVPSSKLALLLLHRSSALKSSSELIEVSIVELRKMGFELNTSLFVLALRVRLTVREQNWEEKVAFYRKFGWSEEEFLLAFKKNPYVAMYSIGKVTTMINYLKELGIEPCRIAKQSKVLGMSFEKRIIPRSSVYKLLVSKGLLRRSSSLQSFFCAREDRFVKYYVSRYPEINGLSELYQEKLKLVRQKLTKASQS